MGVLIEEGDDCIVAGDSVWDSPVGCVDTLDVVEERGLEEVLVSLEGDALQQEEQEAGTWEESCLLLFSRFLCLSVASHEEKIYNLMNNICERRFKLKGKGV